MVEVGGLQSQISERKQITAEIRGRQRCPRALDFYLGSIDSTCAAEQLITMAKRSEPASTGNDSRH